MFGSGVRGNKKKQNEIKPPETAKVREKKKLRENEFFFLPLQTNDSSQPSVIQQ